MTIQLQYRETNPLPVRAALLRGNDPLAWIREMAAWNLAQDEFICLLLPGSISDPAVAALFVIFRDPAKAAKLPLLDPYGCMGEKLFIPCHAVIHPRVNAAEWNDILLWEWQVFHPSAGLIGFEKKDRVDPADVFGYTSPLSSDWSFAHPGNIPVPVLNSITVVPPTAEKMMEEVQKEIGQKPLQDIPKKKEDEPSALEKLTDNIKRTLLKGIAGVFGGIGGIFGGIAVMVPGKEGGTASGGNYSGNGKEGLLSKLMNWVHKNLDELEAKRKNEIDRLLRLFEEDPNEALQYALPLNSPYLNRGSVTQSDTLSRNNTRFELGRLGGGRVTDTWDIGDHYTTLRDKYLKAATTAVYNKDYKKAAYIHAHLLGDFYAAANTLEQGNMYREAAALYKDHLKNKQGAAECLERGGLLLEAIELHKELEQYEKAGDLYTKLDQLENAGRLYQQSVDIRMEKQDFLDAARIVDEKINQREKAKEILLTGWNQSYQYENCLKKYFELTKDDDEQMEKELRSVYTHQTPDNRKVALLNVMEQLKKRKTTDTFSASADEIAYEIVHEEAEKGNIRLLQRLNQFIREDKLISSDTSRYVNKGQYNQLPRANKGAFLLDATIRWIKGVWHRNQFLALGIKNKQLYMARGNWYGNLEYYSWELPLKYHDGFTFINSPYYSNHIILHSSEGTAALSKRQLSKNRYFPDSLTVYCPVWLQPGTALCAITDTPEICQLSIINHDTTLHYYSPEGALLRSVNCVFEEPDTRIGDSHGGLRLIYKAGHFYTAFRNSVIAVAKEGQAKIALLNTLVRFFSGADNFTVLYIVISTNSGCLLCKPDGTNLNLRAEFFAVEIIPSLIEFIKPDQFVLVQKTNVYLFKITHNIPAMIKQYETHSPVVAVFPGNDRDRFSVLEERGQVSWFELGEE